MALLPPFFLDAVTAIGVGDDPEKRQWIGTGFLYGHFDKKFDEKTNSYNVFLVTLLLIGGRAMGGRSEAHAFQSTDDAPNAPQSRNIEEFIESLRLASKI